MIIKVSDEVYNIKHLFDIYSQYNQNPRLSIDYFWHQSDKFIHVGIAKSIGDKNFGIYRRNNIDKVDELYKIPLQVVMSFDVATGAKVFERAEPYTFGHLVYRTLCTRSNSFTNILGAVSAPTLDGDTILIGEGTNARFEWNWKYNGKFGRLMPEHAVMCPDHAPTYSKIPEDIYHVGLKVHDSTDPDILLARRKSLEVWATTNPLPTKYDYKFAKAYKTVLDNKLKNLKVFECENHKAMLELFNSNNK